MERCWCYQYLVVNPENLKTHILNNIEVQSMEWSNVINAFEKTPYIHDWQIEKHRDYELQDAGITKQIVRSKVLV
jgi:hypothetical protein